MKRLILVRHGETAKNVGGKLHKDDDPEDLNETGRKQIQKTAEKLKSLSPKIVYASKEKRAITSGRIMGDILKVPVAQTANMQERNWGDFAGSSWDEISKVFKPMTLDERYNYLPPNGESWKTFETWLISAINKILEGVEKVKVVVTHGGAIRALMPYLLGVPRQESFKYDPRNASITVFDFQDGKYSQVAIDNVDHL